MKKFITLLCSVALTAAILLPTAPASAALNNAQNLEQSEMKKDMKRTTWMSDGVEITVFDTHTLTGQEKKVFEEKTKKEKAVKGEIIPGPSVEEPVDDFSAITLYGPTYRTYDNTVTVFLINSALTFVSKQVQSYLNSVENGLYNIVAMAADTMFDLIKDFVKDHQYTYEGFKMTKAWSDYWGAYMYYYTDVRYDDQYHSHVISVYYYNTGIEY